MSQAAASLDQSLPAIHVPPSLRSLHALTGTPPGLATTLPVTHGGTTYAFAQETTWLDSEHFAVGRWDGSMSIFSFETAQHAGPLISAAVNSPSAQGVQMITSLPSGTIVTSNDDASIAFWISRSGQWTDLSMIKTLGYDPSLGIATSGAWLPTSPITLVVGHETGYMSLWSYDPGPPVLAFLASVNLQNPHPVNPFGSHVIYGMAVLGGSVAVAGSDDGYVSLVSVPDGTVLSQTVFNPAAQRGINSVSVLKDSLLVSNCSVGPDDYNLWYFSIQTSPWGITLLDKANLVVDGTRPQAFNFDVVWGAYGPGPCWFAATEEGVVWMGTADTALSLIGHQTLDDRAIGASLGYTASPGRLVAVIDDLNQFTTGA